MISHKDLMKMTSELPDDVQEREVFIAVPSKRGYMLHRVAKAELVTLEGDMEGDLGVLAIDPVASYHLNNGADDEEGLTGEEVPFIEYNFMKITPDETETTTETTEEIVTTNE